jgi:hypothetical protein
MLTKSKPGILNYGARIFATICLAASLFIILSFTPSYSQPSAKDQNSKEIPGKKPDGIIDTLHTYKDSLTTNKNNLNRRPQSTKVIDKKVTYTASGYIKQDTVNEIILLTDNAIVSFGEIRIKADSIVYNKRTNQIFASGRKNRSGTLIGKVNFKEESLEFVADEITYNLKTRKALIKNIEAQVNLKPEDNGSLVEPSAQNKKYKKNDIIEITSKKEPVQTTEDNPVQDFTGKWVLNNSKSALFLQEGSVSLELNISQKGNIIDMQRIFRFPDREPMTKQYSYDLAKSGYVSMSDDSTNSVKAEWSADKQSFIITSEFIANKKTNPESHIRIETYSITDKGNSLIVNYNDILPSSSKTQLEERNFKMVYDRN